MDCGRQPGIMSHVSQTQVRQLRPTGEPMLRISFLGPMTVEVDGAPVTIASKKARALLAYLVQREGSETARGMLTALLWGERGEAQARASLRQTLSELRASLGAAAGTSIIATVESIGWTRAAAWVDTRALEQAAASGDGAALQQAATLLRGEFLEGLGVDEPTFEQWLTAERERLRQLTTALLVRLMENAERRGDIEEAVGHGQRLLALDSLQEQVHRTVMRLFAAQGRHDAALAQFEKCRQVLESQLGVQPQPETLELQRAIKSQRREKVSPTPPPEPPPAPIGKVSISVLPFTNLTSDPEQEFFADGITEDIIGALSRIGDLFVISRSTSFVYKGRSVSARDAARELGVRHVLEGGVRVAGSRFRVTSQLIDGQTGATIWADRFEGSTGDIFAVQDEITRSIALAMQVKLTTGESARLWEGQTRNLRAWEKMVEAGGLFNRWTAADNNLARRRLEEALVIDPSCTGAMALLGKTHWWDARFNLLLDKEACLRQAEAQAARIMEFGPATSAAHVLRSGIALLRYRHDEAEASCVRAIELAPSDAIARGWIGMISVYGGKDRDAMAALHTALRFSPLTPSWFVYYFCWASMWLGDFATARNNGMAYLAAEPDEPFAYVMLATLAAFEGDEKAAAGWIGRLREKHPSFTLAEVERSQTYKDETRYHRVIDALRRAGLT